MKKIILATAIMMFTSIAGFTQTATIDEQIRANAQRDAKVTATPSPTPASTVSTEPNAQQNARVVVKQTVPPAVVKPTVRSTTRPTVQAEVPTGTIKANLVMQGRTDQESLMVANAFLKSHYSNLQIVDDNDPDRQMTVRVTQRIQVSDPFWRQDSEAQQRLKNYYEQKLQVRYDEIDTYHRINIRNNDRWGTENAVDNLSWKVARWINPIFGTYMQDKNEKDQARIEKERAALEHQQELMQNLPNRYQQIVGRAEVTVEFINMKGIVTMKRVNHFDVQLARLYPNNSFIKEEAWVVYDDTVLNGADMHQGTELTMKQRDLQWLLPFAWEKLIDDSNSLVIGK